MKSDTKTYVRIWSPLPGVIQIEPDNSVVGDRAIRLAVPDDAAFCQLVRDLIMLNEGETDQIDVEGFAFNLEL